MIIDFPGGARVDAHFGNFVIPTDQPRSGGGEGSAPTPFVTFLSTIGTCAGIYVLGFCRQRGLPTEGIRLVQQMRMDRAGWAPGGRLRPEGRLGRAGRGHFGLSGRCARRSSAWEPRERRLVDVPTGVQVAAGMTDRHDPATFGAVLCRSRLGVEEVFGACRGLDT